jgi:deazaflavin-dependent oxidoreductase (nitroreductase family)
MANQSAARAKVPFKRRVQARVMNTANIGMRRVLGLPVATPLGGRLMLAYIVGRKTGRLYRQPLSYVRDGEVLLTPGGGKWKYNLRETTPVRLRIRGRDHEATPELVRDQDEVLRLLDVMAAKNPAASKFIGLPKGPDGKPEPTALAGAIKHGFCIVRWHLAEAAPASAAAS